MPPVLAMRIGPEFLETVQSLTGVDSDDTSFYHDMFVVIELIGANEFKGSIMSEELMFEKYSPENIAVL